MRAAGQIQLGSERFGQLIVAADSKLRIVIAHSFADLVTPYLPLS